MQSNSKSTQSDPFAPPYVPNLLLGEVRDEQEGTEYVILVRLGMLFLFMDDEVDFRSPCNNSILSSTVQQIFCSAASHPPGDEA